jgi:hypothetical protein
MYDIPFACFDKMIFYVETINNSTQAASSRLKMRLGTKMLSVFIILVSENAE